MLQLLQINLQHSIKASASLLLRLSRSGEDIVLIQEPWIVKSTVRGLGTPGYYALYASDKGDPRSCILVKSSIKVHLLPNFSDRDTTVARLETAKGTIWLASAYLSHDHLGPLPGETMERTIADAERQKISLIIGSDANAHHTVWGSTDINDRGESLFDFILTTNLIVSNVGNEPTFITKNRQEVLDITLVSENIHQLIINWKVSKEHSFSDHRYIQFCLNDVPPSQPIFRNFRKTDWPKYKETLKRLIKPNLLSVPSDINDLDEKVNDLTLALNKSLTTSCPPIQIRGRKKPHWWNAGLDPLRKDCRKLFNRAKFTREMSDWDSYKESLKMYKKELRKTKRRSWRNFCGSIEETSEASRLRKILSKNPVMPSALKNSDGSWTNSCEESLNLLLDTHFPGSSLTVISTDLSRLNSNLKYPNGLISRDKLQWALNSFNPYKSAGPDGIIPAELQMNSDIIIPILEIIYQGCLDLAHIPLLWREVKVVFIPKAGKCSHVNPKDLRPISLSSFLLKTFERLIDIHLRSSIDKRLLSNAQHAYNKGKSVETALHTLVRTIEHSLHHKEYTMVVFLDIEGAFNNVDTSAIASALTCLKVDRSLGELINQMLTSRVINSKLGDFSARRYVSRGTPQGGVLSPLLWNLVVNELLMCLEAESYRVIAYADDVAIAVSGKHPNTLKELLQNALKKLTLWAERCGLGINPHKTDLVLFTRKYKIPHIDPPTIKGIPLKFSDEAKYLGLILDKKLSWKPNIQERVKKATVALFSCKKAIGNKWGLQPRITHWLYTSVIRPILTYGVSVWWTALNVATNHAKLSKVQRSACLCISGALRTTPSAALDILFHLIPLDIFSKQTAANTAIRLRASSQWVNNKIGHSTILDSFGSLSSNIDYTIPQSHFNKNYQVFIPSRSIWEDEAFLTDESVHFYTDGSKTEEGVGGGVYSERLNLSLAFRLPDHCSVFQAELLAIKEVLSWLKENVISTTDIRIFSDSQAALKSLDSISINSKTVLNCRSSLTEMAQQFNIHLSWVPGHRDIPGNCRADELAKSGTTMSILTERKDVGTPIATCKLKLNQDAIKNTNLKWNNITTCTATKQIWPKLDLKRTKCLISLSRLHISSVIGVITGHCLIGRHATRLGIIAHDFCRSCMDEEEEETIPHLLCTCPALSQRRRLHLGALFYNDPNDLANIEVNKLSRFIQSSKWFNE